MNDTLSMRQKEIANEIGRQYGVDPTRVLFLNKDNPEYPWLPSDLLIDIARQTQPFQAITEKVDRFIPELSQVVHIASVVDADGRVFERPGVASLNEKVVDDGEPLDAHDLAGSRALVKALNNAGFNPFKTAIKAIDDKSESRQLVKDASRQRVDDLRQIHGMARKAGLIVPFEDDTGDNRVLYETFLRDNFGVISCGGMDARERAQVINKLELHLKAKERSE